MFLNVTTELFMQVWFAKILPANHRPNDRQNPVLILLDYLLQLRLVPSDLTTRLSYLFLFEKVPTCLSVTITIIPKRFDYLSFNLLLPEKAPTALSVGA